MADGRRVTLEVLYNNKKINYDIDPNATQITVNDFFSGEADDISIALADPSKKWIGPWMPKRGATLKATLIAHNWGSKVKRRYLGTYDLDQLLVSGPPNVVTIQGISIPSTSSLKEEKNRSWEKSTLKKIASDVAKSNKMTLYFDSEENPEFDRMDQLGETDLKFLIRICKDAGLVLKIASNKISIFDEAKFERTKTVGTLTYDENLIDYSGKTSTDGLYRACRIQYKIPKKKKAYNYTYTPPNGPKTGKVLVVNETADSYAEAKSIAKKRLRAENKDETTFSLLYAGIVFYYAGQTVKLSGFGGFNGKYIITSVNLKLGAKTETSIELRKCLEGY